MSATCDQNRGAFMEQKAGASYIKTTNGAEVGFPPVALASMKAPVCTA
jgi:hypothetical protein